MCIFVLGNLRDDLKKKSDLAGIDYAAEKEIFLANASRSGSMHTRKAYSAALGRLEAWAGVRKVSPLGLSPKDADDFSYSMSVSGRAASSVRRDIAGASSFLTWMSRRHDSLENPFRGSKARPERRSTKETVIPTTEELGAILDACSPELKAAVAFMAFRGLRVGALPVLTTRAGRFSTRSKGKYLSGSLPEAVAGILAASGLSTRTPFEGYSAQGIADNFRYVTGKLFTSEVLRAKYSVHDLRHFFAVAEYTRNPDIHGLKGLLGHSNIQVTETYLKGLGLSD